MIFPWASTNWVSNLGIHLRKLVLFLTNMLHQSCSNSLCNILCWSTQVCTELYWVGNIVPLWLVHPWNSSQILHDHWPPPYLNFLHNLWDKRWKKCALHLCHMHSSIMYKVIWGYTCSLPIQCGQILWWQNKLGFRRAVMREREDKIVNNFFLMFHDHLISS